MSLLASGLLRRWFGAVEEVVWRVSFLCLRLEVFFSWGEKKKRSKAIFVLFSFSFFGARVCALADSVVNCLAATGKSTSFGDGGPIRQ